MNKIHKNLTIENLAKTDWINQFDEKQKEEIILGLEDNLDVSKYANPDLDWLQMSEIRIGLKENLDVSLYAKKDLHNKKMEEIREELLKESTQL